MVEAIDEELLRELCKQYDIELEFVKKILSDAPEIGIKQWLEDRIEAEAEKMIEEDKNDS